MPHTLETERLRLRPFTPDDTDFIIELLNTPGWLQYIGDRNIKTRAQAAAYLELGPLKSYRKYGYGLGLVEQKAGSKPIGMCGVFKRDNLENPDLGFAFLPGFIGQGYGFEIATASLNHARHTLNLPDIVAITVAENSRSIRLLEKLGFRFSKYFRLPNDPEELLLYHYNPACPARAWRESLVQRYS